MKSFFPLEKKPFFFLPGGEVSVTAWSPGGLRTGGGWPTNDDGPG